jgi:sugar phosphate isomerase/epimerase
MTAGITRRQMISRSAQGAALWALSPALAPLFAAPEQRAFKIGACEWSLRKSGPACFDVAKEIGLDGVQVNMGSAANNMHLRQVSVQQAYLEAARRTGVAIASLGMADLNNVPLKSDPRAAEWLADSIGVMKALDVQVVLVAAFFKGDLCGDAAGVAHTVEVLKQIAPKAEQAGVILGLENYLSAAENLDIVQRVGSRAVQVYYDVGNSTDKGRDVYQEIRMLKGQVCEFHAKDGNALLGHGRIDFRKVREAMDAIDYRGWIQIEAAAPHGLVPDYQAQCKFLKGIFA